MAFSYCMPVVIDHTQVGAGTHTNFPLLIKKTSPLLRDVPHSGHVTSNQGFDIEFFSDIDLTNKLDHQLRSYILTSGAIIAWVRLPVGVLPNNSSDTTIYIGYGDASITTDQSVGTTWDSSFNWVYHLDYSTADSTGHVTLTDSGADQGPSGKINLSYGFIPSNNDYMDLTSNAYSSINGPLTMSAWINFSSMVGAAGGLYYKNSTEQWAGASKKTIDFGWFSDNNLYFLICDGSHAPAASKSFTPTAGVWYYVAGSWDGTTNANSMYAYLNGAAGTGTQSTAASIATNTDTGRMGGKQKSGTSWPFPGYIEEFRCANVARSAGWILTEYNNQNTPDTFVVFGAETTPGGGSSSIVKDIIQSGILTFAR
jgi:hypothetical protein